MDLVVGATGVLGGEICRRLTERGRSVRGTRRLSSDPEAVARLAALGVELVEADLRERASLDAACRGIENVISSATAIIRQDDLSDVDSAGQSNLIEAAKAAGVVRFVYVSVSGVLDESSPLTAAKRTVERRLESSGLTYTILRPTYFQGLDLARQGPRGVSAGSWSGATRRSLERSSSVMTAIASAPC